MANTRKTTKKKAPVKRAKKASITMMDVSKVEEGKHLEIFCVNPESDNVVEALGITEERFAYLESIARKSFIATDKLTSAMAEASKFCKHANELAYVCIVITTMRSQMSNPIVRILGMGGPKS